MAIVIGVLLLAGIMADVTLNAGDATMFLLRKLFLLIEQLNFWS
jgi:hypothetical protein